MLHPPGAPEDLRGRLAELARWEWYASEGGEPLEALQEFLTGWRLPVADLTRPSPQVGGVVGAAILLGSLAGSAEARSVQASRPSPCPDVPDAVAVVFTRSERARPRPSSEGTPGTLGPWQPSWTPADHAAAVQEVREAIAAGEVYQVNVVGHQSAAFAGDPDWVAARLATLTDTPYAGGIEGSGWAVVSASPELFLSVRDGYAITRPIKGTAPRGEGERDRAAAAALLASPKDRAEHVMIVDLERNDLGHVARTGGVKVSRLYGVDSLAGLWHGVSEVLAHLQPGVGLADLLAATFPGGSVTGAPKLAALRQIGRLEPVGRGPAMGALGWVDADGSLTFGLTIRTVAVAAGRAHLWAGGGVTWASDSWAEVAEAAAKLRPLLAALAAD